MEIIIPDELKKFESKINEKKLKLKLIKPLTITEISHQKAKGVSRHLCAIKNNSNYSFSLNKNLLAENSEIHSIIPSYITIKKNEIYIFVLIRYSNTLKINSLNYEKVLDQIYSVNDEKLTDLEKIHNVNLKDKTFSKYEVKENIEVSTTMDLRDFNPEEILAESYSSSHELSDDLVILSGFEKINNYNRHNIIIEIDRIIKDNRSHEIIFYIQNKSKYRNIRIEQIFFNLYDKINNDKLKEIKIATSIELKINSVKEITFKIPNIELGKINFKKIKIKTKIR